MSMAKIFLAIGVGCLALLTRLVMADETVPVAAAPGRVAAEKVTKPTAGESVEQLIGQLDSAEFDTRESASGKLAAKGKSAVTALEKASAGGNLEVSSRATGVLGKLLNSSDDATEKAAAEALQRLADGDNPAAGRKAKSILEKKNGLKNNTPGIVVPGAFGGPRFGGQIIINGGQLIIGGGGGMRTMSAKNVNGVKEINATEDGKTVKIQDDPARGIKIELTEKQNGNETTKKYEAKNVEELKKKLPAGYELYKKYVGDQAANGALQLPIQAGGGNLLVPGNAIPAVPLQPAAPVLPAAVPQADSQQVVVVTQLARHLSARIEQLQRAESFKNSSPESRAELKKQIDELSKRLKELRGQLGDK